MSAALQVDLTVPVPGFAAPGVTARFTVPPGVTVLRGPSGAGKSTLLQAIAGLSPSARGQVRLGEEVWLDDSRSLGVHLRGVGVVFQSLALFPHRTVLENVAFGRRGPRAPLEWLERFDAAPLAHRRVGALSGGEAQRVALARAFASQPRVLLLDEPFTALDGPLRERIVRAVLEAIEESPRPTVLVTHELEGLGLEGAPALHLRSGRLEA